MKKIGRFSYFLIFVNLVAVTLLSGCVVSNQDILIIQEDLSKIKRQVSSLEDTMNRRLPTPSTSQPQLEQNLTQEIKITQKNQADIKIKLEDLGGNIQMVRSKIDELNYQLNSISQRLDNMDLKISQVPGSSQIAGTTGTPYLRPELASQSPQPLAGSQFPSGTGVSGTSTRVPPQSITSSSSAPTGPAPVKSTSQEMITGGFIRSETSKSSQMPAASTFQPPQTQPSSSVTSVGSQTGVQVASIPPQQIYQVAYQDYVNKNYELSIMGFREFLARNPISPLADNAQYWIGESYYSLGKFNDAVAEFEKVIINYPNSAKKYASLLKIGYSLIELKRVDEGTRELQNLIKQYPQTEEAKLAEAKLKSIKSR